MSLAVVLVEKNGTLTPLKIKEFKEHELYKKCGFKNGNNFEKIYTWETYELQYGKDKKCKKETRPVQLSVYGKTDGKAGMENKYDFPPPLDNRLIYGTCVIVLEWKNLSIEQWEKYYETLFGGFENLSDNESEDEAEESEECDSDIEKTKTGYAKDGFVVSDNDSEESTDVVLNPGNNGEQKVNGDEEEESDDDSESTVESEVNELLEEDELEEDELEDELEEDELEDELEEDELEEDEPKIEDEPEDEPEEDEPEDELDEDDDDDNSDSGTKKRKPKTTKKGSKRGAVTKKKPVVVINLAALEKNELMSEGYLSTDDEYE